MMRWIPLVAVWLLPASPGANDKEAETRFLRMADRVKTAKTVQIVCKGSFKTAGFEAGVTATLLLKEGNKMRLDLDTTGVRGADPYTYRLRMISNGARLRMRENKEAWSEFSTTPHWNEIVLDNITRGGFPTGLELTRVKKEGDREDAGIGFRPVAEPADFALWSKERVDGKDAVPIEFKGRNESEFTKEATTILWLAESSGLPAKRMVVIRTDRSLTVTENYPKFALDEALEDSSFSFPADD